MRFLRLLAALRLPVLMIAVLAASAVTITAMPAAVHAAKKLPNKNAKPKKSILKKPGKFKVGYNAKSSTYDPRLSRKEHVRKTMARENGKIQADRAAKRKAKRISTGTLNRLDGLFKSQSKSRSKSRTNTGKSITFSNVTMVKIIPNANRGRKVPKRG